MRISGKLMVIGLSLCFCGGVGAEIYKWVDEDGNVVYSSNPPPGDTESIIIAEPPKVQSEKALQSLRDLKLKNAKGDQNEKDQLEAEQKLAEEKQVNEGNCSKAREMLASFATRPRVKLVQPDGSRVRATEEQRQQRIAEAQSMIKEFCKE